MFNYPLDIITNLKKLWPSSFGSTPDDYWDLPSDQVLHLLIETAFHSSFLTEETRSISFKLIYITKNDKKVISNAPIGIRRRFLKIITFNSNREFNANEILRLSPASDFIQSLICVDNFGSNKKPKLKIWGLMDGGTSWWNILHGRFMLGLPLIKKLIISSTGPGHITISRGENVLLSLNNGELIDNNYNIFNEVKIKSFFEESINKYTREIILRLNKDKIMDVNKNIDGSTYLDFVKSIIFHIREKHHGGVLIIVNDKIQTLGDKISFKYKCNYDVPWEILVNRDEVLYKYLSLNEYLRKNYDVSKFAVYSSLETKLKQYDEAIIDSINFISSLSNIDGSIVFTDKLQLLGFGGEIHSSESNFNILNADTGNPVKLDNYGTRHRSAFRLCYSINNSIGFIISQDGNIKVVKKDKNKLLLWSNINLGFFGI